MPEKEGFLFRFFLFGLNLIPTALNQIHAWLWCFIGEMDAQHTAGPPQILEDYKSFVLAVLSYVCGS